MTRQHIDKTINMMKLICTTILAVTTIIGYYNLNNNKIKISDLSKANIEALAQGESGGNSWCCGYSGTCYIDWPNLEKHMGDFRVTPC